MTVQEFTELSYLKKRLYINEELGMTFADMSKKHQRTSSAIIQALQNPTKNAHSRLYNIIVKSKYMKLDLSNCPS